MRYNILGYKFIFIFLEFLSSLLYMKIHSIQIWFFPYRTICMRFILPLIVYFYIEYILNYICIIEILF